MAQLSLDVTTEGEQDPKYFCVYDQKGKQVGHVSVEDIERERAANPHLRYEVSRPAEKCRRSPDSETER